MNKLSSNKHKCKQCKCEISPYYDFKEYAYKINNLIFCSYHCMQDYRAKRKLKFNRNCPTTN